MRPLRTTEIVMICIIIVSALFHVFEIFALSMAREQENDSAYLCTKAYDEKYAYMEELSKLQEKTGQK